MNADFVRTATAANGTEVVFRMSNGMHTRVPLSILSKADQDYIASIEAKEADLLATEPVVGKYVDVFIATGQSNAFYPNHQGSEKYYGFGRGVRKALVASRLFSNPVVVMDGSPGHAIGSWWAIHLQGPNVNYDTQFFDTDDSGTGKLEATIKEIIADGNTPRFRGFFWWQGESDGIGPYAEKNTSKENYEASWQGLLEQLEDDLDKLGVGSDGYFFVVNTVAESGDEINGILRSIAKSDRRGVIFDTQVAPYNVNADIDEPAYGKLHVYQHELIGIANAELFIQTFIDQNDR